MNTFMVALLLGLWSGVAMVLNLSGLGVRTALLSGVIAGLCVGDVDLGFQIGAQCLLLCTLFDCRSIGEKDSLCGKIFVLVNGGITDVSV